MGEIDKELLRYYQTLAQQQIQAPPLAQSPYQGIGIGMLGSALGGWGNAATSTTQDWQQAYQQPVLPVSMGKQHYRQTIKFNRINEVVEMRECDNFVEPLDELRVKVATWLYN